MGPGVEQYLDLPHRIEVLPDEVIVKDRSRRVWMASNPELRGCMAQGDTPEEAVRELREAREVYLSSMVRDGLEIPMPQAPPLASAA